MTGAGSQASRWVVGTGGIYVGIFCAIFFTTSFDLFLNLRLGGFSFRFCYLAILFLAAVNLPRLPRYFLASGDVPGLVPLLGWSLFLFAFAGNTPFLARNIGYLVWHAIHILFIVILVNNIGKPATWRFLMGAYCLSFGFVGAFGILQFVLGVLGIDILIRLWWFPGLPRINGFSYEPSFFGSYLIIGWVLLFALNTGGAHFLPKRLQRWTFAVLTAALVISSSRMAILIMGVFMAGFAALVGFRAFLTLRVRRTRAVVALAGVMSIAALGGVLAAKFEELGYLFAGLGVGGQSSHSAEYRLSTMGETWQVFLDSPIAGVSLGGVASAIAEKHGEEATSNEVVKVYEGLNIFVEVLAASGVFGFAFFLWYLFEVFRKPLVLSLRIAPSRPELALVLRGMLLALAIELGILAMNQNILRPFLWAHIAMLSLTYKIAKGEWAAGMEAKAPA